MVDEGILLSEYEDAGFLQQKTIYEEFHLGVHSLGTKTALIEKDTQISYLDLDQYINKLSRYFVLHGLKKGDRVLLQLPNRILYVAVLLGLVKLGVQPVLLLPSHREKEVLSIADRINPKAYIGTVEYMGFDYISMLSQLGDYKFQMVFVDSLETHPGIGPEYHVLPGWSDWIEEDVELIVGAVGCRDIALFLLSGGTTDIPKLIPRIHEAYVYNARAAAARCELTCDSVYLAVLSTSHDLPLASPGVLGTLLSGGTVILCESPSFDEAFVAIEKYKATLTAIVPAIARVWSEVLEWYPPNFSSMKQIIIGAEKLDKSLGEALIRQMGVKIQQGYGLGEGITCFTKLSDPEEVSLTTQGTPISPGDSIKIVDLAGNKLPPFQVGELLEKGPYTFLGYYGNPELTQSSFDSEGYFRTGDKAYLDARGNVIITGRVKEQINRAGENVIPAEIEALLREHPEVKEAAVFGMPDETLGERTVAVIISINAAMSCKDIIRFFHEKGIARFKVPDEVHLVQSFPYINVGKVNKDALKKRIMKSK